MKILSSLTSSSSGLGFVINLPSTRPTLTPPRGLWKGMSEIANAAEAPFIAATSEGWIRSWLNTVAAIIVSAR